MEALTFLDTIFNDWKIIVAAFAIGGLYYEAKIAFKKIIKGIENTSNTHSAQNIILDAIHDKIEGLDKRLSKIEGSIEMVQVENHSQSVRLTVIETMQDIEKPASRKRRQSV
jgi:hypothetical protein